LGYLVATLLATWPLALNFTAAIPGDSFDGWQNYWNLWWFRTALVERVANPLVTDLLYYPTGVSLYFHTLNPFNGLLTLPVQLAAGLIPAYNAVVIFSWVLAGYGTFLLARWATAINNCQLSIDNSQFSIANSLPPFLAGLIFTLAPFHMAHLLGHMQVMSLEWVPFYVLSLLRALRQVRAGRPWLRSALLAGLFLVLNGLCDWYFVLYLFLFTCFALVWHAIVLTLARRRAPTSLPATESGTVFPGNLARQNEHSWAGSVLRLCAPPLVAGVVFVVLLSPWLLPMVREATQFRFMVRPPADLYLYSVSVADFLIPSRLHPLSQPGGLTWPGNQIAPVSERTVAVGYVGLFLAVAALFVARRRALFWLAALLFFAVLALGPHWHWGSFGLEQLPAEALNGQDVASWTPYGILNRVIPFMRISRSVGRFALMVQLCLAVAASLGFHGLLARLAQRTSAKTARRWSAALGALALVLLLLEFWTAPYPVSPPDTPAYYGQLAAEPDARAVLNLPMNYDRPGYLLYQTVHGKPLTVAYISRDDPRTLTERVPVLQHFRHLGPDILDVDPAVVGPTILADLGVGTVVLDRYKMPGGDERTYTEQLARAIFAGQPPVYEDERITAFQVKPVQMREPYLALGPLNWGALTVDSGAPAYRVITGSPATLSIHHLAAPAQLRMHYRTAGAGSLRVMAGDGKQLLAELPAAPDGGEAVIDLAPLLPLEEQGPPAAPLVVELRPAAGLALRIDSLRLDLGAADSPL
jgi:hypothetical protein